VKYGNVSAGEHAVHKTNHVKSHTLCYYFNGVVIGRVRRAVYVGPSLWVEGEGADKPCVGKRSPLDTLHTGPLQPCYTPLYYPKPNQQNENRIELQNEV